MKATLTSGSSPLSALKEFDWRRVQRLADPQSIKDLDNFLDELPVRAGKNALIIAATMWMIAAIALFFLFHNTLSLRDIQKQLAIAEGTRVSVPQVTYNAVEPQILLPIVEKLKKIYPTLTIEIQNNNMVAVKASTTRDFALWRAAIGDLAYGSAGWKLSVQKFCTGSGCSDAPLAAALVVQDVNIQLPEIQAEDVAVETNDKTTTP